MFKINIDIETYSEASLMDCGVYRYAEDESFEILLFGYSIDGGPKKLVDLAQGEEIPPEIEAAIHDPTVVKSAFNANFERVCISEHLRDSPRTGYLSPIAWHCSAVHSRYIGLPGSLAGVAKALKLDEQKGKEGKALIRYFCMPCKPTKANGGRTRNLPEHDPEKWEHFKGYCLQDVAVEQAIDEKLEAFPIPESERRLYVLDQQINDRGVRAHLGMARNAIQIDDVFRARLFAEAKALTGLDNPNSPAQIKHWIGEISGIEVSSLAKDSLDPLKERLDNLDATRMIEIRQLTSRSSTKKYQAIMHGAQEDDRIRGLFQYYGASRTGRWSGRRVQLQNLPQNHIDNLDLARDLLIEGDLETMGIFYDDIPTILSQLIRTALIPEEGTKFIVSDFSAIEARVIAWLADEKWRIDVFKTHGKIYEASASAMFNVPLDAVTKRLRAKGKVAELACGFGGSVGAIKAMDKGGDLTDDEAKRIVQEWRAANPGIVRFWKTVSQAAMAAVETRQSYELPHGLRFLYARGILFIELPSGRRLAYPRAKVEPDPKYGSAGISYYTEANGQWIQERTYGGKLVENIVQATARDCLAEAMLRLEDYGAKIVAHVHDEVILEAPKDWTVEQINEIMGETIPWGEGLPLAAAGFEKEYYMKD